MSGGGQLKVTGYIGLERGLYADLTVSGKAIRIRYPQGVSSLADATLRLQGPQNSLLLSGTVEVTRFAISSDLDMTALASQANGPASIISPDAPSNHVRLDIHLITALHQLQNALAKLAGDADLHLRGYPCRPAVSSPKAVLHWLEPNTSCSAAIFISTIRSAQSGLDASDVRRRITTLRWGYRFPVQLNQCPNSA